MKITVLRSNLSKSLNQVSKIVGSRTTLPVLSNVLISAKKAKIKFSATDLEVGITTQTIGKVDEEGEITVPARLLSDFVTNNKDESIDISTDNNIINLKSENFEASINGISADEFPTVPEDFDNDHKILVDKNVFAESIKKVIIATANDETRPVLTGVLIKIVGNELILAATDSYRLSESRINLAQEIENKEIVVPARTMTEVSRVLGTAGDFKEIEISIKDNQISFKLNDTLIVSRLIEGSFPNYMQIVPKDFKINIQLDLTDLMTAVKMSSLFAKDLANNNIKMILKNNELTIASGGSQSGSSKSRVHGQINGADIEIAFNARYLLDILNVIGSAKIIIGLNDNASSGVIKSDQNDGFIYIIMPLKVDN